MNDYDMKLMQRMYRRGVGVKNIAYAFGYSKGYVNQIIQKNRDKFPYRVRHASEQTKDECVRLVLDEDWTQKKVANEYGFHVNTISRWVNAEIRRRMKKAQQCQSQDG